MRKEELFNIIGEVDEQKVATAGRAMTAEKKSRPVWLKWGAIAACLCLVVVGAFVVPTLLGEQNVETPMGQGFFNAVVLEIENEKVIVECTESLQGEIPAGAKVQISTNTLSSAAVPELEIGDNIRILYIGKITDRNDTLVLKDTVSIFLLDENGVPIVEENIIISDETKQVQEIKKLLQKRIESIEISGYYDGSVINAGDFVVEDFDKFAAWFSQLSLEHRTFAEGQTPSETQAGGNSYTFDVNDGALTFTYADGGTTAYIVYDEEWYEVLNPTDIPFK